MSTAAKRGAQSEAMAGGRGGAPWTGAQCDRGTGAQCDRAKLASCSLGLVAYAPSKVLRIDDPSAANPTIEVVWEDGGRILSAASVAAVYRRRDGRRRLLIGAPFDDRMLIGDLT